MAFDFDQVTVTDEATLIASSSVSNATSPTYVSVHNPGATVVFIGPATVTGAATGGLEMVADSYVTLPLYPGGNDLYGITASGSQAVEVLIANGPGD
jgi:hypothetical protein